MKKVLHVGVLFLLIFGLFNVAPMSKAFALSYDGSSPVSTGCANDAVTKSYSYITDSHDNVYGKVELKWSAKCKTSWGKDEKICWITINYFYKLQYLLQQYLSNGLTHLQQ